MGNRQSGRVDDQPFLASDRVAVPINDPLVANRGPLHPVLAVLQTYPRVLVVIVVLLAVLLIVAIAMLALITQTRNECEKDDSGGGTSNSCGWHGKDLSALSTFDLPYTSPDLRYQYYLRPCGYVSNERCSDQFGGLSQACTWQQSNELVWSSGSWYGNNAVSGAWSTYGTDGLAYHTTNGGPCTGNGGSRSLYVYYTCQSGATGLIDTVVESGCSTHYYVYTQYVC